MVYMPPSPPSPSPPPPSVPPYQDENKSVLDEFLNVFAIVLVALSGTVILSIILVIVVKDFCLEKKPQEVEMEMEVVSAVVTQPETAPQGRIVVEGEKIDQVV